LLGQVNETRDGQFPFAAVLSCIDSRTSAELIFDQGLGHLQHPNRWELRERRHPGESRVRLPRRRGEVDRGARAQPVWRDQGSRRPCRARSLAKRTSGNEAFVQSAISKQSTVLNEMKQAGRIDLVGAMYDVASGSVKFLEAS
jgi:carbonic anhydrase